MRREVRAELDRQSHHDLMHNAQALRDLLGLDPTVLDVEFVRDFDTRRTLEQQALAELLGQAVAKLSEQAKPAPKRKVA